MSERKDILPSILDASKVRRNAGQTHLMIMSEELEAFPVDSAIAGFALSEQVKGDAVENGEVVCCVA